MEPIREIIAHQIKNWAKGWEIIENNSSNLEAVLFADEPRNPNLIKKQEEFIKTFGPKYLVHEALKDKMFLTGKDFEEAKTSSKYLYLLEWGRKHYLPLVGYGAKTKDNKNDDQLMSQRLKETTKLFKGWGLAIVRYNRIKKRNSFLEELKDMNYLLVNAMK